MPASIQREPIDVAALQAAVARDGLGGAVTFVGIVRNRSNDGRAVTGLRYEAFEPMAAAEFGAIEREVHARWGEQLCVAIAHRVGEVGTGEVAVAVVVAAVHRAQAFEACRYAIDELKRRAPIWKREAYADGSGAWQENAHDR